MAIKKRKAAQRYAQGPYHPPQNAAMIQRIEAALSEGRTLSSGDASFYMHESMEATLMRNGMSYDAAHKLALKKYDVSRFSVYPKDGILAHPEHFNSNWLRFWERN